MLLPYFPSWSIVGGLWVLTLGFAGLPTSQAPAQEAAAARPHVLFIVVDDLRTQLGCYGQSQMVTPQMDALAASGTRFERAYCNLPVCGPSRASVMTGLRPTPDRFVKRATFAEQDAPEALPLHSYFKRQGYHTLSNGKVFDQMQDHRQGWSEAPWRANQPGRFFDCYLLAENLEIERLHQAEKPTTRGSHRGPAYEAADVPDSAYTDGMTAERAIADLRQLAGQDKPFFMAVGFPRPHLPFIAPKRYWDLYDFDQIQLPKNDRLPEAAPAAADRDWNELRLYAGIPATGPLPTETARSLIHGYYACVSYVDALVGSLLDELKRLKLDEKTIVILWSDHGFNLGEHGMWCKHTCFDTNMRVPLIVRAPGLPAGVIASHPVELVDLYPSLCDLAGVPLPEHLEGASFVPLMCGITPEPSAKNHALGRMYNAETLHTGTERYTEFFDLKTGSPTGQMLFDHGSDPHETRNIANQPQNLERVETLARELRVHLPANHPLRR